MQIAISNIRRDGGTQPRAGIRTEVVDDYSEALTNGATFPDVVVFYDGTNHWLADGFHRVLAFEKAGRTQIDADMRQGTCRDAILHSVGANSDHGLRRTCDDKRRAVQTLLKDSEWASWSDNEIAKKTGTSHTFVGKIRGNLTCNVSSEKRTYKTKHGTTATMDTSAIGEGQRVTPEVAPSTPTIAEPSSPEPLEQVAEELNTTETAPDPVVVNPLPANPFAPFTDTDLIEELKRRFKTMGLEFFWEMRVPKVPDAAISAEPVFPEEPASIESEPAPLALMNHDDLRALLIEHKNNTGKTNKNVSKETGVAESTIGFFINNKRSFSSVQFEAISKYLLGKIA